MIVMSFLAVLAFQQSTTCSTIGNVTRCDSAPSSQSPDLTALGQAPARTADSILRSGDEAASDRRAAAYAQVGQLIADKRCDDARRLAGFYGQRDLIRDTAKACPK